MSTEREYAYKGRCFCGAVEVRAVGKPAVMGYCHCTSCRQWSAAPVNAFTLWQPSAVTITRGADRLQSYSRTDRSIRKWCGVCGGHVLNEHSLWKMVDVYAALLPELSFQPQVHVNYSETVLRMRDGLPKLHDLPPEMGGSGIAVAE
jgi:hypothetical protein